MLAIQVKITQPSATRGARLRLSVPGANPETSKVRYYPLHVYASTAEAVLNAVAEFSNVAFGYDVGNRANWIGGDVSGACYVFTRAGSQPLATLGMAYEHHTKSGHLIAM